MGLDPVFHMQKGLVGMWSTYKQMDSGDSMKAF